MFEHIAAWCVEHHIASNTLEDASYKEMDPSWHISSPLLLFRKSRPDFILDRYDWMKIRENSFCKHDY